MYCYPKFMETEIQLSIGIKIHKSHNLSKKLIWNKNSSFICGLTVYHLNLLRSKSNMIFYFYIFTLQPIFRQKVWDGPFYFLVQPVYCKIKLQIPVWLLKILTYHYNYLCCFDFLIYASFSTDHETRELALQLLEQLLEKKEEINIQTAETEETAESGNF